MLPRSQQDVPSVEQRAGGTPRVGWIYEQCCETFILSDQGKIRVYAIFVVYIILWSFYKVPVVL